MTTMLLALLALVVQGPGQAETSSDVRQLVVFDFLPGKAAEAVGLFEQEALPLYRENAPMLRFRGYREVESPVSLDLVVVSSFDGMEGMDDSNRVLREQAEKRGTSVGSIYGRIGALSQGHTDSFVEIVPELSWGAREDGPLVAFESVRIAPGDAERYEHFLAETVIPWERDVALTSGGETGRYLVSDGFDFLRLHRLEGLGAWHRYLAARKRTAMEAELDRMVEQTRVIILAPVEELSVR